MKSMNTSRLLVTLALLSLLLTASPLQAQVYKVVDENGNVTYTDRPPAEGARPVDLPPLSVVEAPSYPKAKGTGGTEGAAAEEEIPLRTLRRMFRNFAITSPEPEESIWNPEQPIIVSWSVSRPLQQGMSVTVSVDGFQKEKTRETIVTVDGLERGAHTITAVLMDKQNRRIATAEPVTFYVRRPSVINRARGSGG